MSSTSAHSWQSVLDTLTARAKKDGLLSCVKSAKGFQEKINKVRDSIVIRNKLATWISLCSESHYSKSGATATRLREEGNFKFKNHDNEGALRLYAESVICAPEYGPELSLAYGNRSAALYHLGYYKDCLQDLELAFKYRYPKNLEYKLYQRRGQCENKLGHHSKAILSFEAAIDSLKFIPKLSASKLSSITKDLQALIIETKSMSAASVLSIVDGPDLDGDSTGAIPLEPLNGFHCSLSGASSSLQLQSDPAKGRFVVTSQPLHLGDLLFMESPYACVLLPEHNASHCSHCCGRLLAAVPCLKCTQPRYCSESCRLVSWTQYHQYECGNLDLLHSVGLAHLAFRVILICGFAQLLEYQADIEKNRPLRARDDCPGGYPDIYNLVGHLDDIEAEDLFQYAVTAALLTTCLERRTRFFRSHPSSDVESGLSKMSVHNGQEVSEEHVVFVGGVILRHIVQLISNASAIFEVGPQAAASASLSSSSALVDDIDRPNASNPVFETNQYRIASAIYPGASMMNHSCDPNVINSFYKNRLFVRAIKKVAVGAQVLNCYGPHFRRHTLAERKEVLKSQYNFDCDCQPCTRDVLQEFVERFSALRCRFCQGPIRNPHSEGSLQHRMPCWDCGREQEYSSQIEQVFVAYDLFKKGMESLRYGNMSEALPALQSCYQIRTKAMYSHHREVTEVADQLARCYALMGSFQESAQYLKVCMPSIEERFGAHSIEVGHELIKYADVLLSHLQDTTRIISKYEEQLSECRECLERAAVIFELHYGKWNRTYQEIAQKLADLSLLWRSSS